MASLSEKSLIVMSGGLDSTTMAYKLQSEGKEICGIYFDIGYKPRVPERNSVRLASHRLGIPLEIVSIPGIFDMVTGFYPTEFIGLGELDKGQPQPFKIAEDVDRYVVGFHVIISIATYYAQLAGIKNIYTALTKEQYDFTSGLKDFTTGWEALVSPLNRSRSYSLQVPFSETTKDEIIKIGSSLGVPFEDTWSCHDGHPLHCGKCSGCISRKGAFTASGVSDPTKYEV